MLADVFENLRNMCPENFVSAPGLALQAALKNAKAKLDLLTDINVIKYMKDYDSNLASKIPKAKHPFGKYLKKKF